ncbi:MAG: [Fe-Fe] hydrogenase large subunit C-terminal domain-containing protein [Bacteroidales bacterium]
MEEPFFYHALHIDTLRCIGCSHCMRSCVTEAIRISNGKAKLYPNRCIDCGHCYIVCPMTAIDVAQDDFNTIFQYDYRVVLLPAVFMAQFSDQLKRDISPSEIRESLMSLGFTHVFEIEQVVDLLAEEQIAYVKEHADIKPLISTFCPAVVRLIQVKFPALTGNMMLLKQPSEVAAMYYKQKLLREGAAENEIGLFYVTPCAAKIAAIKTPVGEEKSEIQGVINMDFLFNRILKDIKNRKGKLPTEENRADPRDYISPKGLLWSLPEGESRYAVGRSLSIDGIEHISDYLEKLEDIEDSNVDFLELKGCAKGCSGGVLVRGLRFLIAEEMRNRAFLSASMQAQNTHPGLDKEIWESIKNRLTTNKVLPRSMMKLDKDLQVAMQKMEHIRETLRLLPQKDCGVCGAPSCLAFAEDIANDRAELKNCVFLQTYLEEKGNMQAEERVDIFKTIWGEDIFKNEKDFSIKKNKH